jgi:hypothetical protein
MYILEDQTVKCEQQIKQCVEDKIYSMKFKYQIFFTVNIHNSLLNKIIQMNCMYTIKTQCILNT